MNPAGEEVLSFYQSHTNERNAFVYCLLLKCFHHHHLFARWTMVLPRVYTRCACTHVCMHIKVCITPPPASVVSSLVYRIFVFQNRICIRRKASTIAGYHSIPRFSHTVVRLLLRGTPNRIVKQPLARCTAPHRTHRDFSQTKNTHRGAVPYLALKITQVLPSSCICSADGGGTDAD